MDKKDTYDACLNLFRNQKYTEALLGFRSYLARPDLCDLDRLRANLNLANCLLEMHWRGQAPSDWVDQFRDNLQIYFESLGHVESQAIAPPPLRDFFALTLRFLLEVEPLDAVDEGARAVYRQFVKHGKGKLSDAQYLQMQTRKYMN